MTTLSVDLIGLEGADAEPNRFHVVVVAEVVERYAHGRRVVLCHVGSGSGPATPTRCG